ncbi:IS256 family transposase, partial [Salmonella enterica subsp. enterica serovar Albany]|nr:IS256 family transposase [Salmonella enterica subsp. enterica serovar Albany]
VSKQPVKKLLTDKKSVINETASREWNMPIQGWRLAMSRFLIEFGGPQSDHL